MLDLLAQPVPYQTIIQNAQLSLTVKRLDLVHPEISGNKFYKLKNNIHFALAEGFKQLLTFGGAFSNHIAATAAAGKLAGLSTIGIIRGEELAQRPFNPTLMQAQANGMQLYFISRHEYRHRADQAYLQTLQQRFPQAYIIPEGGTNSLAVTGCKEILSSQDLENYDVFCCAVGTGGTMSGLIEASSEQHQVLGFPVLKGDFLQAEITQWTNKTHWQLLQDYHFGGYAKTTPALLDFIQHFKKAYSIPLEPIYTAKMLFGLIDLIQKNYFQPHTRILAIHSGGLQGFPLHPESFSENRL